MYGRRSSSPTLTPVKYTKKTRKSKTVSSQITSNSVNEFVYTQHGQENTLMFETPVAYPGRNRVGNSK